jgi:hypothetical protein
MFSARMSAAYSLTSPSGIVYDGVHDKVVTVCPNGLAIVIDGPSFDLPTLKLVTLLQDDLGIDHGAS